MFLVDELAKTDNGVMYSVVCQDFSHGTKEAKEVKTIHFKKTAQAFPKTITKIGRLKKGNDKSTESVGEKKDFSKI